MLTSSHVASVPLSSRRPGQIATTVHIPGFSLKSGRIIPLAVVDDVVCCSMRRYSPSGDNGVMKKVIDK